MKNRSKSRRKTPWDKAASLTETQEFLKVQYTMKYDQRHPDADESEIQMINSYMPKYCPYCGSEKFTKKGWMQSVYKGTNASVEKPSNRQQEQYLSRKIPVSKWIEYCLNLFRYVSLNADSWNNRNAIFTSKYWLEKVFLTLENSQNNVILEDTIWLDETYYSFVG